MIMKAENVGIGMVTEESTVLLVTTYLVEYLTLPTHGN